MEKFVVKISNLDITPRKVRLAASVLVGMTVADAEAELLVHRERAAQPILKLLRSAVANAKNAGQTADNLFVSNIRADKGMRLKRWLPRAQGRATPLHKQRSHLFMELSTGPKKKSKFSYSGIVVKKSKKKVSKIKKSERSESKKNRTVEIKPEKTEKPGFFKRTFRRKTISN